MKNILKIMVAAPLAFIIPSGSALALGFGYSDPIQVQLVTPTGGDPYQGVVNGLNDINSSIKANTKVVQDAQAQQQIAARNPECARYLTAYIREHDVYLNQTNQMINDYIEQHKNDQGQGTQRDNALQLNYLYTLYRAQNQRYIDYTNSQCSYPVLNASCIESSGPNAEMKSFDATTGAIKCKCVSGYVWNSTSSSCVVQQVQQASIPKTAPAVVTNQTPTTATNLPTKQVAAPASHPTETSPVIQKTTIITSAVP